MKEKQLTPPSFLALLRHPARAIERQRANVERAVGLGLMATMILPALALGPVALAQTPNNQSSVTLSASEQDRNDPGTVGNTLQPTTRPVVSFPPVDATRVAQQLALDPAALEVQPELKAIHEPKGEPAGRENMPSPPSTLSTSRATKLTPLAPLPSATGVSPAPSKTFKGEFSSVAVIPPDTMGAVGIGHIVTVSNDRLRIQNRDGVELQRMDLTSFWAGVTVKGTPVGGAFDPKVYFDRFNNRFILISSVGGQSVNSGAVFAVSQTGDPTGLWNRWSVVADPTSTAAGGHWIDFPSVGFNKNWIVIDENVFNYGTAGAGYYGQQVYVLDKQAAYNNTLGSINIFEGTDAQCVATPSGNQPFELGCGFTLVPTVNEDNTSDTVYLIENWNPTTALLRLSRITGTPTTPAITIGTQFPQGLNSWRSNATRIQTSGGYVPQRQVSAHLPSPNRLMANDARIQNAVLRNGSLWTTHTVMLSSTPSAPNVTVGGTANPDNHSGVQWWQIDPSDDPAFIRPAIQFGRIEDPTANNCHNGANALVATPPCNGSTLNQVGQFYAFPNISVNQNNDVLIGFSQFSALTYGSGGYAFRASTDPINTTRDPIVFRPGQAFLNLGSGSGVNRQNRWGDYSATQTDPLNDTDFWTVQEYVGVYRNFGIGVAAPWETWWAQIKPSDAAPSKTGNLIISQFRLRGPQGPRDEFIELYNPGNTAIIVNTTDNSDGWALAANDGFTTTTFAVIPNGTVIPARAHFLLANNPDSTGALGAPNVVYSLSGYASNATRGADSDTGYYVDLPDNSGIAIFKTSTVANFSLATRMDSAGFDSLPTPSLFKEGNGLPAIATTTPAGQVAFFRALSGGTPRDTGSNEGDFQFVDPVNESFGLVPQNGAAGPKNLGSPKQQNAVIPASLVDPLAPSTAGQNRIRNAADTGPNKTFGTMTLRRKFTNNTGAPLSQLRFRVVDITTYPVPDAVTADVRALSSASVPSVSLVGGGTASIEGTVIEEPPTQNRAGGYNSTQVVNLASPLAPGGTVNVQWLLGVETKGNFRFFVNIEAQ